MVRTSNKCEQIVVKDLESRGYDVFRRGWPDLIAVDQRTGKTRFIEVKPVSKRLKPEQVRIKKIFKNNNLVYEVWYVEQLQDRILIHENEKPIVYGRYGKTDQKLVEFRLRQIANGKK